MASSLCIDQVVHRPDSPPQVTLFCPNCAEVFRPEMCMEPGDLCPAEIEIKPGRWISCGGRLFVKEGED